MFGVLVQAYDSLREADYTSYNVDSFKQAQEDMRMWNGGGNEFYVSIMRLSDALIIAGNHIVPGAGNHQSAWD